MKKLQSLIIVLALLSGISLQAQKEDNKKEKSVVELEILTSAQCDHCKTRLEKEMAYEKGVKSVSLDLETKKLTIKYRVDKTDPEKLRTAVSKIGYDADDVAADPEAYAKLPACCQKGGHDLE